MNISSDHQRPITIAMLALGGQGGGVLTKWLVDLAESNGYRAQSTYVAGVAQRTGATVYCVEMFSQAEIDRVGRDPVFTPYPVPGDVDLVVAGELAETGRAIQKGFVTPNTTTLIASSHRVYSILEKEALGDGIKDQGPVVEVARKAARNFIVFDMDAASEESGSVISAVMFGAISASGALPFSKQQFERTIQESGRAIEANLLGFSAGFAGAAKNVLPLVDEAIASVKPTGVNGEALEGRVRQSLPDSVQSMALHGALRALDYQDVAYANSYLDQVEKACEVESTVSTKGHDFALTTEVARQLALQMCYEDTIRVADLKTRVARMDRIRQQLGAREDQPVHIVEYFHPRIEEVCDTLPAPLGRFVLASTTARKLLAPLFRKGRHIKTSTISGFLMLRIIAKLKRWRRRSYRFGVQSALIEDWLTQVYAALIHDYEYATSIANCIEMVKGYGDTYERGLGRYREIVVLSAASDGNKADLVRKLRTAAENDEQGIAFAQAKAELGTVH